MLVFEVENAISIHPEHVTRILGSKGWSSGQHNVKDYPEAENVRDVIVGESFKNFRSNVPWRTTLEGQAFIWGFYLGSKSIIDHLYLNLSIAFAILTIDFLL